VSRRGFKSKLGQDGRRQRLLAKAGSIKVKEDKDVSFSLEGEGK